jgi:hypothetical protein
VNLVSALVVTAVVGTVALIRAPRWRALVYSLPLPMTVVLATTGLTVDGTAVLGVVALVGFFVVVAGLHTRLGWPILAADVTGVAAYVAVGAVLPDGLPVVPVLAVVGGGWLVLLVIAGRPAARTGPTELATRPGPLAAAAKLVAVFAAALLMVSLGGLLGGLVVTFPYAGVLVAVEVRAHLSEFTRHFARTAFALVAFLAGAAAGQAYGTVAALVAGWAAFGLAVPLVRRAVT